MSQIENHRVNISNCLERFKELLKDVVSSADTVYETEEYSTKPRRNINSILLATTLLIKGRIEVTDNFVAALVVKSHPYWQQIKNRDTEFLKTNGIKVFNFIPPDYSEELLGYIIDEKITTPAMLEAMWDILNDMIKYSISFTHFKRELNEETGKYTKAFPSAQQIADYIDISILENNDNKPEKVRISVGEAVKIFEITSHE